MGSVDYRSMQRIAKAIRELDEIPSDDNYLKSDGNVQRLDEARRNLINILFNCGYELQYKTYRVIKSTHKRQLIKSIVKWQK